MELDYTSNQNRRMALYDAYMAPEAPLGGSYLPISLCMIDCGRVSGLIFAAFHMPWASTVSNCMIGFIPRALSTWKRPEPQ